MPSFAVRPAPDCLACDTSAGVSPAQARALAATRVSVKPGENPQLVRGVAQYVPLNAKKPGPGDIVPGRLAGILTAGLGCWPVQHVKMPGWVASEQLGSDLGGAAAEYAHTIGFLAGVHLGVDQEGCASVGDPVIRFLDAWAKEAKKLAFAPLCYDGFAAGLTALQLYQALPDFRLYWASLGPRAVAVRGFAIEQHEQRNLPGLPWPVDLDSVGADALGGRLQWMVDLDHYPDDDTPTLPSIRVPPTP